MLYQELNRFLDYVTNKKNLINGMLIRFFYLSVAFDFKPPAPLKGETKVPTILSTIVPLFMKTILQN